MAHVYPVAYADLRAVAHVDTDTCANSYTDTYADSDCNFANTDTGADSYCSADTYANRDPANGNTGTDGYGRAYANARTNCYADTCINFYCDLPNHVHGWTWHLSHKFRRYRQQEINRRNLRSVVTQWNENSV